MLPQDQEIALKTAADNLSQTEILPDYLLAGILVLLPALVFLLFQPAVRHWFVLPAMACGLLMGVDLVRWLRGELDPFDPKGLVGLILFHGWFLAPLLHVYWNTYAYDFELAADPRPWLGGACLLNCVGMISYKIAQRYAFSHTQAVATFRQFILGMLIIFLVVAAVMGVVAQAYFYRLYLAAIRLIGPMQAVEDIRGAGLLLMLGDSLPTLLALSIIATTPSPWQRRTWLIVGLVLLVLAVIQFLWSGLRGSRSAFVGIMFFSLCLIHFWWRRLRAVYLLLALFLFLPFMYYYGFYKGAGKEALKALESEQERLRLERITYRTFPGMLLGDLARADVQARIVQELVLRENLYQYRWGRTYLNSLSKLIPYPIWRLLLGDITFKDRWHKGFAFYELAYGSVKVPGYYPRSSRVYGLTGEALLNFGFLGVPLAWFAYGLAMGWLRRKLYSMPVHDARWPLICFAIGIFIVIPVGDSDNIIFAAFKGGFMLFLLVYLTSRKISNSSGYLRAAGV